MSELLVPDVTEMTAVHRVFRQAFAAAPALIGGVPDGDAERAAVVGGYYANVLEFLRVHHTGEDELLFPRLVSRVGDPDLVNRIAGQHHAVEDGLGSATEALARWVASGATSDGQRVVAVLADLEAQLMPHLDEEEVEILPLVAEHITVEEWGEMAGHAMGSFQGDNMFLILGLVREQFTQEQKDRMLEGMPPPAVEAWKSVGIGAYTATVAALMGTTS